MRPEYGGYMPLELRDGPEYFDRFPGLNILRLNCGRSAIVAALLSVDVDKAFLPYYICKVVRDALELHGIPYELYYLDSKLEPIIHEFGDNDWLLYVNYFGLAIEAKLQKIAKKYERVVVDNTQAFYARPIIGSSCFNVYLPRKFFGVIDGAYLVWSGSRTVNDDYPLDTSWDRGAFLLESIELGTNAAYQDNLQSMESFSREIRRMSKLTQRMLRSIAYDHAEKGRISNYKTLSDELRHINKISSVIDLDTDAAHLAPFVYPLLIEDDELRSRLVSRGIYVSQWWKYLLEELPSDSIEASLSRWLLPLPVDHRYNKDDMRKMSAIVNGCINGE